MAGYSQGSLPDDLHRWCGERLQDAIGTGAEIRRTTSLSGRVSSVWLLEVGLPGPKSEQVYLKHYPNPEAFSDTLLLLARLDDAARLRSDIRLPRLIAIDPRRGLLLISECSGTPLIAVCGKLAVRSLLDPGLAIRIWRGVGAFLKTLHSGLIPPQMSLTRVPQLCAYTVERFELWAHEDRRYESLAYSAIAAVNILARQLDSQPVPLVPCHGDVSVGNIIVGETVGMVDFDDLRLDLAAVDLSQALIELEEFGRLGGVLRLEKLTARLRRSLLEQYGLSHPSGPQFWLPHLRNLSVFLLTLARLKRPLLRYSRTVQEIRHAVQCIRDSNGIAPYWRTA